MSTIKKIPNTAFKLSLYCFKGSAIQKVMRNFSFYLRGYSSRALTLLLVQNWNRYRWKGDALNFSTVPIQALDENYLEFYEGVKHICNCQLHGQFCRITIPKMFLISDGMRTSTSKPHPLSCMSISL